MNEDYIFTARTYEVYFRPARGAVGFKHMPGSITLPSSISGGALDRTLSLAVRHYTTRQARRSAYGTYMLVGGPHAESYLVTVSAPEPPEPIVTVL
jgi:hypothetical protein